jgi:hypothetical protein
VLTAQVQDSRYIRGAGIEKLKGRLSGAFLMTEPSQVHPESNNVVAAIDPAPSSPSLIQDLLLESGRMLPLTALDPAGRPLPPAELLAVGLTNTGDWEDVPAGTSELKVAGLAAGKGRTVGVRHKAKQWAGELVLRGDETGPQTVTLRPCGIVTGRVVDADGQPVGGGNIHVSEGSREFETPTDHSEVGRDGRFRIEGLLPGKSYHLQILSDAGIFRGYIAVPVSVGAGETRDLGDVTPREPK